MKIYNEISTSFTTYVEFVQDMHIYVDNQRSSFKKRNDEKTKFVDPMADEDNIQISIVHHRSSVFRK
jgi:hypothetical protein